MTRRSRRWQSGFTLALLVGVLFGCAGIREDELACEDAVSHLQECCFGFSASNIDCTYVQSEGCLESSTYPEITISQSACIRNESCAELVSTGVCARAEAAPPSTVWADETLNSTDGGPQQPQVCP
jgi:hypothetical protein